MNVSPAELSLIQSALAAIEQVLARAHHELPELPFYSPTALSTLSLDAQEAAQLKETATYRAHPTESAVHFCLTSASALLDVSQTLMTQPANPSPTEQLHQWKALISHTKIAGRSAYRAALILADQKSGVT